MNFKITLIKDKKYLALKRKVLFQHKSLPLGNYCSSFDLNLLLLPFDQMIREKSYTTHYIRYMDDFVIFCVNRRKAFVLKDEIKAYADEDFLKKQGIFKPNFANMFVNSYLDNKLEKDLDDPNNERIIWSFYIFQQWYEMYIA